MLHIQKGLFDNDLSLWKNLGRIFDVVFPADGFNPITKKLDGHGSINGAEAEHSDTDWDDSFGHSKDKLNTKFLADPLTRFSSFLGLPNRAGVSEFGDPVQSWKNLLKRFVGWKESWFTSRQYTQEGENPGENAPNAAVKWLSRYHYFWNWFVPCIIMPLASAWNLAFMPLKLFRNIIALGTEMLPAIPAMLLNTLVMEPALKAIKKGSGWQKALGFKRKARGGKRPLALSAHSSHSRHTPPFRRPGIPDAASPPLRASWRICGIPEINGADPYTAGCRSRSVRTRMRSTKTM